MLILTALKRTTALAAIAALPLAPAAAFAESAQVTGTQPPSAETGTTTGQQATGQQTTGQQATGQQATGTSGQATGQGGQADAAATATEAKPGSTGAQAGEASDEAKSDEVKQKDTAGKSAGQSDGQSDGQTTQAEGEAGNTAGQSGAATGQGTQGQQAGAGADDDMLVAKVGDREIRRSDVLTVIGMLPPQLQQQPPEMLIPIALDQLVMRELILQEAREDGLGSDPAVDSLQAGASERDKEDAMVQVWLEKELGDAVTEEKVRQTYDTVKQQMGDQAPDVDTLRPQIEQELRQQAFLELSRDLQEDAEITLYGPDGKAVTQ